MTLPFSRRRRRQQPGAGFPAAGRAVTELIDRAGPPDWDGTTIVFGGASGTILPSTPPAARPAPATPPSTEPPAPPRRPYDEAIFTPLPAGGFGLLCGMDLWRRHADPEAAWYEHMFDALRVSALRAGWRPDAHGRWCCPRCVSDRTYTTPHPVVHWHPAAPDARLARAETSREAWLARPATEHHADASAAADAGDPAAEFWFRAEAEADMLARTAEGVRHGRHEAGTR